MTSPTGGITYETIASMKGVEQMDLLDGQRSIVLARTATGLSLSAVALPEFPGTGCGLSQRAGFSMALCATFLAGCSAVSAPEIWLDLGDPKQPSVVVGGLSGGDLAALDRARSRQRRGRRSFISRS